MKFKRKSKNIDFLPGAIYLRRKDLKHFMTGELDGKFHIQNPDSPEEGLCYVSTKQHLNSCLAWPKPELMLVNEQPKQFQICQPCYNAYIKRRYAMSIYGKENQININGATYVRIETAEKEIKSARESLRIEESNHSNTRRFLQEEIDRLNKVSMPAPGGEVRTIQGVEEKQHLAHIPGRKGQRIFRTALLIKSTDVKYRAGQKIRIIIEEDRI